MEAESAVWQLVFPVNAEFQTKIFKIFPIIYAPKVKQKSVVCFADVDLLLIYIFFEWGTLVRRTQEDTLFPSFSVNNRLSLFIPLPLSLPPQLSLLVSSVSGSVPHNIRRSPVICDPSNPHLISLKRGSIQFAVWRASNRPSLLWQVSTLANNWSPVPCPVPQCDTEPKLFEARWKEPHNRGCGGEDRRGRTRERLHSQTAISRDEAFLNKQTQKKTINTVLVYQVESSLWLCSIYFLLHCFSRLLKYLWAVLAIQFSLERIPGRPISFLGSCVFALAVGSSFRELVL